MASLGAGAIHVMAVGAHREHTPAVVVFTVLAVFQLGWGVVALSRPGPNVALVGAIGNACALVGWLVATTTGIWFVSGLDDVQPVQLADGLAAGLASLGVAGALIFASWSGSVSRGHEGGPALVAASALVITVVAVSGMASARTHDHDDASHAHGPTVSAPDHAHAGEVETVLPTEAYDPAKPIDLGGVEGVTPEQQSRAEKLLGDTLEDLPRYADLATAEANGFRPVGDAEHWVNWSYVNDGRILDPEFPESLVYRWSGGGQQLVAAMFMLPDGSTLDVAPDVGGKLTQWHVHEDICFTADPVAPQIAQFVGVDQPCPAPLAKRAAMPMLHIWIVPHECGPFAALDGIAAGQIEAGEERLCDHVHGTP